MANTLYNFSRIGPSSPNRSDAIEMAARAGYGAKGIVYALVGALAAMAGFGYASGKLTGTRGALEVLNGQSWSTFVLGLIAAGLIGFTIWRFFQAIKDTEDKGSDLTGYAQRLGLAISGGIYGWLAYYAVRLAMDAASGGSSSAQERAATVMSYEGGQVLIGVVGIVFVGVALYQGYRAISKKFKKNWKTSQMSATEEKTATLLSGFGIGARAVAFLIIGGFLSYSAITANPQQARGLEGAITQIAQSTPGQVLVIVTGFGLLSYGIYCFVNALFRYIEPRQAD